MMFLMLWRALQRGTYPHPLFERLMAGRYQVRPRFMNSALVQRYGGAVWAGGALAGLFILRSGGWLLLIPLVLIGPLSLGFGGTISGTVNAARTAGATTRIQARGHIDLLAATPPGRAGAYWAICQAVYLRNRPLSRLRDVAQGIYIALFMGLLLMMAITFILWISASLSTGSDAISVRNSSAFVSSLQVFVVLAAFYADYLQSDVIGSLIGMLVPTFVRGTAEARGLALGSFLALQSLTYALMFVVAFMWIPAWLDDFDPHLLFLNLVQLSVFVALREAIITVLWHALASRLGADSTEMRHIIAAAMVEG